MGVEQWGQSSFTSEEASHLAILQLCHDGKIVVIAVGDKHNHHHYHHLNLDKIHFQDMLFGSMVTGFRL